MRGWAPRATAPRFYHNPHENRPPLPRERAGLLDRYGAHSIVLAFFGRQLIGRQLRSPLKIRLEASPRNFSFLFRSSSENMGEELDEKTHARLNFLIFNGLPRALLDFPPDVEPQSEREGFRGKFSPGRNAGNHRIDRHRLHFRFPLPHL